MSYTPPELTIDIPSDIIALQPADKRELSKLLVYSRKTMKIVHIGIFRDIPEFICGDLLVVNDTKVLPIRLQGKKPGGAEVDILFTGTIQDSCVSSLINPGRRLKPGLCLNLPSGITYTLTGKNNAGEWVGKIDMKGLYDSLEEYLDSAGLMPLPPYIHRQPTHEDRSRYQTVYASNPGSLAAPTAGFHFTTELLKELTLKGCTISHLTLDVGLGTFQPIRDNDITGHQMHSEKFHIPGATADLINSAKNTNRPVTGIGTTVVRALESSWDPKRGILAGDSMANIFIHIPYKFKVIDRLITNFHMPDSTLIQMIAALIGWEAVNLTYGTAIREGFHFFSYGDAMLILD